MANEGAQGIIHRRPAMPGGKFSMTASIIFRHRIRLFRLPFFMLRPSNK
jgi:hypothetical protein